MASKQPVHGGSAQTKEFDVDLLAAGVHWAGDPESAEAVVTVDANATLRVEISAPDRADWQLDVRALGGSFEILRGFRDGAVVHEEDIADWVKRVADVVGERLEGGR
ncbi:hypothetical protein EXE49_09265 [Halorubrum sp. ASP121]|uniref:hypothetical protein n=1 Tax=Halorubrum sp. ASP121 TaxID=1855858 RepID=UPI0010F87E6C|nr:hypothetical protein [Halorubrum sp. ASP121]TKX49971.1 hypothetical protein EXE49_09265 [Halorubrum sp. ASP121]